MTASARKKRCLKLSTALRNASSTSTAAPAGTRACTKSPNMLKPAAGGSASSAAPPRAAAAAASPVDTWFNLRTACMVSKVTISVSPKIGHRKHSRACTDRLLTQGLSAESAQFNLPPSGRPGNAWCAARNGPAVLPGTAVLAAPMTRQPPTAHLRLHASSLSLQHHREPRRPRTNRTKLTSTRARIIGYVPLYEARLKPTKSRGHDTIACKRGVSTADT